MINTICYKLRLLETHYLPLKKPKNPGTRYRILLSALSIRKICILRIVVPVRFALFLSTHEHRRPVGVCMRMAGIRLDFCMRGSCLGFILCGSGLGLGLGSQGHKKPLTACTENLCAWPFKGPCPRCAVYGPCRDRLAQIYLQSRETPSFYARGVLSMGSCLCLGFWLWGPVDRLNGWAGCAPLATPPRYHFSCAPTRQVYHISQYQKHNHRSQAVHSLMRVVLFLRQGY